jgi:outer membrane protein assembly factor BamB
VSDERLRDLERRVAASPTDFRLGHELVRELERAGESRRALDASRRLEGAGDLEARRSLARLLPPLAWLGAHAPRDGVAEPAGAELRVALLPLEAPSFLVGATDETILVATDRRLLGVDATTLATIWAVPRPDHTRFMGLRRDALVVATPEGRIQVLDARHGTVRASHDLGSAHLERLVVGEKDAILRLLEASAVFLAALDLESGAFVWKRAIEDDEWELRPGPGRFTVYRRGDNFTGFAIEARESAKGELLWRSETKPAFPSARFAGADPFAHAALEAGKFVEHDLETGARAEAPWGHDRWGVWIGAGRAIDARRESLALVDLSAARPLWNAPVAPGGTTEARLAGKHVWVARYLEEPAETIDLLALEAEGGSVVRRERCSLPSRLRGSFELVALDGALLLTAEVADGVLVHRIGER